ncbi:hypothetical protein MTR67_037083 [Solanum verrucosum]|uniref:Cytochrome P450 n=1 Tax=Solanum verrucosum TaxID=315347 RepID=A0AAF0ZN43_SOLVR|nr:hypothetical protein MTR67_037083 [Solanum verrucosum]
MASEPLNDLQIAALTLSIVFLTILWYKLTSHKEESRWPPGPRGLPIVGFLPFLHANLHHHLTELSQVSTCTYGGVDIGFSPYGSYWSEMRKLFVREMLSNRNLEACYSFRRHEDIVIGGTDSTITTVEWVMTELLNNPETMSKVQQELKHVVGMNNVVEESHLPELHYLDAVLKETLRLHLALPLLLPKRPSQCAIVGGYKIPKGTKVFLNVYAIHRDPQVWESPLEFQPERFLSRSTNLDYAGNNMKYLPFGSGRRICAGLPLAEKMVMFMLASFSFDWKLPEGEKVDLSEGFGLVIKKSERLFAIPTPRLPNLDLYQ